MYRYIDGYGKEFKLGEFTFQAFCEGSEFEEMDRCGDDKPAILGQCSIQVCKNGEFIGGYNYALIAYAKDGFNYTLDDSEFMNSDGETISDKETFKDKLPQSYGCCLDAISSLCENIKPQCEEFLNDLYKVYNFECFDAFLLKETEEDKYYDALYEVWDYFAPRCSPNADDIDCLIRSLERDNLTGSPFKCLIRKQRDFFNKYKKEDFYQNALMEIEEDFNEDETDDRIIGRWNYEIISSLQSDLYYMFTEYMNNCK